MIIKNSNPFEFLAGKRSDPIIEIYFQINHLKHLLRQGWPMRGIPEDKCESVGDHSFAVALLGMLIAKKYFPGLDMAKVIKMSLIHELGEIDGGDITPFDGIDKNEKHALEERGVRKIFADFPEGREYLELWLEFEENRSPEARFVKQIDKLEMAMQAAVYAKQYGKNLDEFIESAEEKIEDEKLMDLLNRLKEI
ncbi:MAG: HD domain-containing protein [Candidatus Paceibacterota bacterium]|jgi:putative hydrolase of HD superfamily